MTVEEKIQSVVRAHPDWDARRVRKALWRYRVPAAKVREVMGEPLPTRPTVRLETYSVRSLLTQYDDVGRLRRYLDEMPQDEYRPDEELRRELRIPPERWRIVIQNPNVSGWRYRLPNQRWVWLHPRQQEQLDALIRLTPPRDED